MTKHNRKAVDFARYQAMKAKDEMPDKKLIESAKTFQSLHESLLEELPVFLSLAGEFIEIIVNQFAIAQAGIPLNFLVKRRVVSSMDGWVIRAYYWPFSFREEHNRRLCGHRCRLLWAFWISEWDCGGLFYRQW
jgi:hypothetical protein